MQTWMPVVVNAMLGGERLSCGALPYRLHWNISQVIMMNRIHAMYQQSKTMLIFLVVVFLASMIATGVMTTIVTSPVSGGKLYSWLQVSSARTHWRKLVELILSGTHICLFIGDLPLILETWIPTIVWEVLVLFLAVWIIIKHFRELRQSPTGSTIKDCFAILIKGHVLYFVAWVS